VGRLSTFPIPIVLTFRSHRPVQQVTLA